jgi:pantoate--beta-alanine ligase
LLAQLRRRIESRPAARVDYLAVVDPDTLEPLNRAAAGAHLVLAVWVGRTRLIDNGRL